MAKAGPRSDGVVWIAEDHDAADSFKLIGRFSGYFDRDDGNVEEFKHLSADEAVAWGRARASVVLIRTGDSGYYSAGERNPDPEELPLWAPPDLELEPRRPRGFEALDNTEQDASSLWDVRVNAELPGDPKPFHDAVRASTGVRDVLAPAPGYDPASAAFLVEAVTYEQAVAIAEAVRARAVEAMVGRARKSDALSDSDELFWSGCEVYPHRPGEPVTGPGVMH